MVVVIQGVHLQILVIVMSILYRYTFVSQETIFKGSFINLLLLA